MEIAVVGDGFAGLCTAYHLAEAGHEPDVYGRPVAIGQASQVSAGMLGVAAENDFPGIDELLLEARKFWPGFAEKISEQSGIDVGLGEHGTLFLAASEDELDELQARYRRLGRMGFSGEWFEQGQVEDLHPLVTGELAAALHVDEESWINPRRLYPALTQALEENGVEITSLEVKRVEPGSEGGAVLRHEDDTEQYDRVVLAAGHLTSHLLPEGLAPGFETEPLRGQYLLVESPGHEGWPVARRVGELCYLVPALGGDYLYLGATAEHGEWRPPDDFAAAYRVLDRMTEVLPELADYEITERGFGVRPVVEDRHPVIGPVPDTNVFVHTAHFRNGVLLSPLCGKLIAQQLLEESPDLEIDPLGPARLIEDEREAEN